MASTYSDSSFSCNQPPICTSNVRSFYSLADDTRRTELMLSPISVVSGAPGTGKTTAAQLYLADRGQQGQQSPAIRALITIPPRSTPRQFLNTITGHISGQRPVYTAHEAFQQTLMVLEQRHMQLLMLDQADYLQREHLELLRMLVDQTPCSILLIGLPQLLSAIEGHLPSASRLGLTLEFRPLSEDEVLDTFLPRLLLPGWVYDPKSEANRHLGSYLWQNAHPSLRRLRTILAYASLLTQQLDAGQITLETVRLALQMMAPGEHPSSPQSEEE